jgi:type VI secretion system protein ImpA
MANVESVPPVIDIEALLQPISEESPSGESLQYSGLFDEIRESRRADDNLNLGQWQHELKVANFRQVINLAVPALTTQTKDMQVVAWLAEALTKENGFAGLRDSLRLMSGIQENFWETCFPEIDDGDEEGRANAIEWLDRQTATALREVPITGGAGLSFIALEESKRFDIPDNLEALDSSEQDKFLQLKAQAEQEQRVTGEMWRKSKGQTRRAFYETLNLTLEECWEGYQALNRTIEEKFDPKQMPGMNNLKKSLDEVRDAVKKVLQEKRQQEPDPDDVAAGDEANGADADGTGEAMMTGGGVAIATGAVRSRQDALKRLSEVAEFFRKTEPHSPVSYLVQRAVKWGNMPLDNWLQEVIKDETVLGQLRETLGFGGYAGGESSDSSDSYNSYESSESSNW